MQQSLASSDLSKADVPGRIAKPEYYSFWKDVLQAPEPILKSLREGYSIPLKSFPPRSSFKHNATARDPANADFLDEDIALLETIGAI